jgi:hypothetical protein
MESGSEEPLFFALTACSLITANHHKTPGNYAQEIESLRQFSVTYLQIIG